MDKHLAKRVQDEAAAALAAIAAKHGMTVSPHGGTLGDVAMILKFEFKTSDKLAIKAKERADFNAYCGLFDLTPEDFGAEFVANGRLYTIAGLDLKKKKYPIMADLAEGGRMWFATPVVEIVRKGRES